VTDVLTASEPGARAPDPREQDLGHRFRVLEASSWAPLYTNQVAHTYIHHKSWCPITTARGECTCTPVVHILLKTGERFELHANGVPHPIQEETA
jgi:hypothetical protein